MVIRSRLEVWIGWATVILGITLALPPGRQAFELLARWGGLEWPWWAWPSLLVLGGAMVLIPKCVKWRRAGLYLSGVILVTVAMSVYLSYGANSLAPLVLWCALGAGRARSDLRAFLPEATGVSR
jgi:hypothetical protein